MANDLFGPDDECAQARDSIPAPKRYRRLQDASSVARAFLRTGREFDKVAGAGASRAHPEAVASLVLAAEIAALLNHLSPRTPIGIDGDLPARDREKRRASERAGTLSKLLPLWVRVFGSHPRTVASAVRDCSVNSSRDARELMKVFAEIGGVPINARRVGQFLANAEGYRVRGFEARHAGFNNNHVAAWRVLGPDAE